jgi:nucleoid-associated protein YgaU
MPIQDESSQVEDDRSEEIAAAKTRRMKLAAQSAKPEYIGEYTVVAGDSMGAIAAKYYGSAVKEKWMAIYEANKELIGDNPTMIHPGQTLKIPKLVD